MRTLLSMCSLAVVAACATESPALSGPETGGAPDLTSQAFRVTLDLTNARAEVESPRSASASSVGGIKPSLSLIGAEGVKVFARNLTCAPIPKNREQKRCRFDLSLSNLFRETDLMTPTTFPKPPEGVDGVLLFPLSATVTGGGGGPVVPSPEWDGAPVNFFNDFGSCPGGSKTDCLRYETIPSPFYANTGSPERAVGFDVPIGATAITTYVVVAADLRENPFRTFHSPPILDLCGSVTGEGVVGDMLTRLITGSVSSSVYRGFCTFNGLPSNVIIHSATLRVNIIEGFHAEPGAEYLDYGSALEADDYGLPATHDFHELNSVGRQELVAGVTSEVQEAYANGATRFPFRFRVKHEGDTYGILAGWINEFPSPELELVFTLK
jgi:hypothetical protein